MVHTSRLGSMELRKSVTSRDEEAQMARTPQKESPMKSTYSYNDPLRSRYPSGARTYPYHTRGEDTPVSVDSGYLQDIENAVDAQKAGVYCSPRVHAWVASQTSSETIDAAPQKVVTAGRTPPLRTKWNWIPAILLVLMFLSGVYYFYVRVIDIMNAGWPPYQIYFLALEGMGVSAFLPYAILLTRGVYPTGSPGLDEAGAERDSSDPKAGLMTNETRMHVRVLVPTYKEPLPVIQNTIMAALSAPLPASVQRTIYLCDDGKNPAKADFVRSLNTPEVQYVTGRVRKPMEINGKSANLNNCLKKVFGHLPKKANGEIDWTEISNKELLVVFDADMCAKRDFFLKILEVMLDDDIALCLTPQAFHNISPMTDLFNNINTQFWEYWLPGAFAWGYIACTGTNFCLRIRSLAHCGWFPEYTITEDYALGMELKARGYKATYLMDYLAIGEAPEEVRNVFRQRSRWTKGHYQVFFSRKNPLINWDLPFFQRLWYSYAAYAPFCTIFTIPGFMVAPFISVLFGIHPLVITYQFVLAATIYFILQFMIQNYVREVKHLRLLWFAQQSNYILWFTYTKACFNTMLAVIGLKNVMFKSTDKGVVLTAPVAAPPPTTEPPPPSQPGVIGMVQRLASNVAAASPFHRRDGTMHQTLLKPGSVRSTPARSVRGPFGHAEQSPGPGPRYSRIDESEPHPTIDDDEDSPPVLALRKSQHATAASAASALVPKGAATPMSAASRATRTYQYATTQPHTPTAHNHTGQGLKEIFLQERNEGNNSGVTSRPMSEVVVLKSKRMGYPMGAPRVPEDMTRVLAAPRVMTVVSFMDAPKVPEDKTRVVAAPQVVNATGAAAEPRLTTANSEGLPLPPTFLGGHPSAYGLKQRTPRGGASDRTFADGAPSTIAEETGSHTTEAAGGHGDTPSVAARQAAINDLQSRLAQVNHAGAPRAGPDTGRAVGPPQMSIATEQSYESAFLPMPSPYLSAMPRLPAVPAGAEPSHPLARGSSNAEDGSISVGAAGWNSSGTGTSNWGSPAPTQAPPGSPVVHAGMGPGRASVNGGPPHPGMIRINGLWHENPAYSSPAGPPRGPDGRPIAGPHGVAVAAGVAGYTTSHDLRQHPAPDRHHVQPPPNVVDNLAWTNAAPGNLPAIRVVPRGSNAGGAGAPPPHMAAGGAVQMGAMPPAHAGNAHVHYGPTYVMAGPPPSWNANTGGPGGIPAGPGGPYRGYEDSGHQHNPLFQREQAYENAKKALLAANAENSNDVKAPAPPPFPEFKPPPKESEELQAKPGKDRLSKIIRSFKPANVMDFGKMFDPLAIFIMWAFNLSIVGLGLWQLSLLFNQPTVARFKLNSPITGNPYLVIAILWALTNSVPFYMFLHYCISSGPSFKFVTKYLPLTSLMGIVAMVMLWLMIPADVPLDGVMDMATASFLPTQTFNDTNQNFYFLTSLNETQVDLTALLTRGPADPLPFVHDGELNVTFVPNLLGGIIGGYDHVKSVPAAAFAITWLAWGLIQFPLGFSAQQTVSIKQTIQAGADLIMRSNLNIDNPANPVFVGMIGDPRDYTVISDPGYDPTAQGKSWTDPDTDPQLAGSAYRKAWLLTRESVGSDLLSDAAAALAAASIIIREDNPTWANMAVDHAKYLFAFAQSNDTAPVSYCNFMPCSSNVTVRSTVKAQEVPPPDGKPACWYADWDAQMCKVAMNKSECNAIRLKLDDVFKTKAGCCNMMANTKTYSGAINQVQGLCALPDDQFMCYTPDLTQRTCYEQQVNLTSGKGCSSNTNSPVFGTLLSCCNWLQTGGIIDPVLKPPTGLCARQGTEGDFLTCYIPNIINATCDLEQGAACRQFGVITSFDHAVGCCNYLVSLASSATGQQGQQQKLNASAFSGVCTPWRDGEQVTSGIFGGRRLQDMGYLTSDDGGTFGLGKTSSWWSRYDQDIYATGNKRSRRQQDEYATRQLKRRKTRETELVLSSRNQTANLWPMPDVLKIYTQDPCTVKDAPDCQAMTVDLNVTVTYYNSSSVLDDMAWGAVWLYRATNDPKYLGAAQRYIARHYVEEVSPDQLLTSRDAYVVDWDNLSWAVNVQLGDLTGLDQYTSVITRILSVWVFGDAVQNTPPIKDPLESILLNGPPFEQFNLNNATYNIIPTCKPNSTYENNCYDGLDNDCNGLTDLEDPRCGLFPILYTPSRLAYSKGPSLGNVANMAFLAMVHADVMTRTQKLSETATSRLRCWTLSQIGHIIGSGAKDERSYVVGYGRNPPTRVQHRASSCPLRKSVDDPICDWDSGFRPGTPNPQLGLIQGALVDGPDIKDVLVEVRSSDMMRVSLQSNVGFLTSIAGLQHTGTQVRTCESLLGVWQRYVGAQGTLQ